MKRIDTRTLASLTRDAAGAPRRRANLNLHPELADPVQRLLIAIEPGSYVRPHRHSEPAKWELFVILSGRLAFLTLDSGGKVLEREVLDARGPTRVLEIPPDTWHTTASLEPGTVIFEIKPGPYSPLSEKDFAEWAPREGEAGAAELVKRIEVAAVGDCLLG